MIDITKVIWTFDLISWSVINVISYAFLILTLHNTYEEAIDTIYLSIYLEMILLNKKIPLNRNFVNVR